MFYDIGSNFIYLLVTAYLFQKIKKNINNNQYLNVNGSWSDKVLYKLLSGPGLKKNIF